MKALAYEDWELAGFYVKKGERSSTIDKKGRRAFTRDQVEPANERTFFEEGTQNAE